MTATANKTILTNRLPVALRRFGTLLGFLGITLFFWINIPETFMTARNWLNISQQISMLAVIAFTMSEEGEARVLGTLVGVLILGVLDNGLTQMNVDSFIREILIGAIIVVAVASSSLGKRN